MTPTLAMVLMAVGCAVLVLAEYRDTAWMRALGKMTASSAFLGLAWSLGAMETPYGQWVFGALVLSWIGDALLLSRKEAIFQGGILAFLLAHVAFAVGFLGLGINPAWAGGATAAILVLVGVVLRWLLPHMTGSMRFAGIAYVVVIALMVVLSVGAWGAGASSWIPVGATVFLLSDLSVARDRFVTPGFINGAWGLPAYYLAQGILASTVG